MTQGGADASWHPPRTKPRSLSTPTIPSSCSCATSTRAARSPPSSAPTEARPGATCPSRKRSPRSSASPTLCRGRRRTDPSASSSQMPYRCAPTAAAESCGCRRTEAVRGSHRTPSPGALRLPLHDDPARRNPRPTVGARDAGTVLHTHPARVARAAKI